MTGTIRDDNFIWIDSVRSSLFRVCRSLCQFACEIMLCPLVLLEYEYRAE